MPELHEVSLLSRSANMPRNKQSSRIPPEQWNKRKTKIIDLLYDDRDRTYIWKSIQEPDFQPT